MGRSASNDSSEDSRGRTSEEEYERHSRGDSRTQERSNRRRHEDDRDGRRKRRSSTKSPPREDRRRRHSRSRSSSPRRNSHRSGRSDRHRRSSRDRPSRETNSTTIIGPPAIDQTDFDQWMNVLNAADAQNDVDFAREKYSSFLERYPFCYGFWQKFADFEKRNGNISEAMRVAERGVLAIPMSIDLWLSFLAYTREFGTHDYEGIENLRELYERALSIAGLEFQSDRLWLDAIGWEQTQYVQQLCTGVETNAKRVGRLFDRLLATPTAHHGTHLARYASYISSIEPHLVLDDDEYEEIVRKLRKSVNKGIDELTFQEPVQLHTKMSEDGKTWQLLDAPGDDVRTIVVTQTKHDPEILELIRREILARRQKIHDETAEYMAPRLVFESQIKRPYFHVKGLDVAQLTNWIAYIDFEIKERNYDRIEALFERCLIACALYEEYWIKFARWVWKEKKSESATREIYRRAAVHVGNSLQLALASASFEEARGHFEEAITILDKFKRAFPGYVAIELRLLATKRRQIEGQKGASYATVLAGFDKLINGPDTSRHLRSFYAIKLSRFHQKVRKDRKAAEKVIQNAIMRDENNVQLYLQLIDIAYSADDYLESAVIEAFDIALRSDGLRIEDKIRISQRKLDFLEELSHDIELLDEHQEKHLSLIGQVPSTANIRTKIPVNRSFIGQPMMQQQWPMQPMMMQPQQFLAPIAPVMAPVAAAPPVQMQIVEPAVVVKQESFDSPIEADSN